MMLSFRLHHHLLLPTLYLLGLNHVGVVQGQQQSGDVSFHGSGSSVGSRCFWHVLETLRGQTKISTRGTYRSTGSGAGVTEFLGNITHPFNDFASADYPLHKEQYDQLAAAGQGVVHLPVVMGAVGVFHAVPLQNMDAAMNLNLTSCLVARIFNGEIEDWTHPDILAVNPNFELPVQLDFYGNEKAEQNLPIKVAHRSSGSGTTNTFTTYLHKACPEHWSSDVVGDTIAWPMEGSDRLIPASGTSGMIEIIETESGAIGYSDAGAALDKELDEVALKVEKSNLKDDFFLTSKNALSKDGIAAALDAEGTNIPESGDVDWSGVDTINQVEGYIYAWPMSALTYAIIRKDLPSFIPDPRAQSLLVAFLRSLYDPNYVTKCEEDFLFLPVKNRLRDVALQSIDLLEMSPDAPEWIQETTVLENGAGQGDYVISTRRSVSSLVEQDLLAEKVSHAETTLEQTVALLDVIQADSALMALKLEQAAMGIDYENDESFQQLVNRADAGFIMAIVALSICFFLSIMVICWQEGRLRELESRAQLYQVAEQPAKKKKSRRQDTAPLTAD